jgi:hypothetical protein
MCVALARSRRLSTVVLQTRKAHALVKLPTSRGEYR